MSNPFGKKKAFIGYVTAGDPDAEHTEKFVREMMASGADMVELGIPFSDPSVEPPALRRANVRGVAAGMCIDSAFEILESVRKDYDTPVLFRLYANLVFRYGYDAFFKACAEHGVYGVVIPDVPYEERDEFSSVSEKYGVHMISVIVSAKDARMQMIAKKAQGFIYLNPVNREELVSMVPVIRKAADVPLIVAADIGGLDYGTCADLADGAMIGTELVVNAEEEGKDACEYIRRFVQDLRN